MKKELIFFVTLITLSFPTICSAIPPRPGYYVSGFLGVSVPTDQDATSFQFGPGVTTFNDRVEFDPSINIGGTAGFDFGIFRLEGDLSYTNGEMSTITEQNTNIRYTDVDGRLDALAMLFNAFVDLHNTTPITPYFGGGIGFATLHLSDTFGTDTTTGFRELLYLSDDETVFAYQAGAGIEIAFNRMFSLDVGYRYFATEKATFNNHSAITTEIKQESHNVSTGFRWKF